MANPDIGVKFLDDVKDNTSITSTYTPYQIQEFNESDYKHRILDSLFNYGKSKKDQRKFDKYINSDEGKKAMLIAKQRHDASEQSTARAYNLAIALANKYKAEFNKIGQEIAAYEQNYWNENKDELQKLGWSYTVDSNNPYGGIWTKSVPIKKAVVNAGKKTESEKDLGQKEVPVVKKDPTWEEKMTSLGYTSQERNDGSIAFVGDGNIYYSNGRMSNSKGMSDYDYTKLNPLSDFHKKYSGLGYNRLRIQDSNDFAYQDPTTNYIYYPNGRVKNGNYWGTVNNSGIKWDNTTTVENTAYKAPTKIVGEGFLAYHKPNHNPDLIQIRNELISSNKNLRDYHHWNYTTGMLGDEEFPIVVTTGLGFDNPHNNRSYYYNPQTEMYALIDENWLGKPKGVAAVNNKVRWYTWDEIKRGATYTDHKKFFKQGGTMNRINYFQQGGAAPQQQDMQQQVVALVQAAMQGDQKATQIVNQIMEAAKAGDQQAIQLAQMIQQVAQQMQGQAQAARWGAKLGYIRSLKFANGGKACRAGVPIQKVEEKACGGKAKKAKKRYFGGWL